MMIVYLPTAKNYREHIYFVLKLGEPALLGSKKIAYEYACILGYPLHMKNEIRNFVKNILDLLLSLKW